MDSSDRGTNLDASRYSAGGYYVPGGGSQDAIFQSLFLRLRPKVIVNDNIYIKSEWWVGDPIFGIFGSGLPYSTDQRQFYSSQSRGSVISAQRIWGEFVTDIGTFQLGRMPLNWGLGVVWNSGDDVWSRYMSTGDAVRWVAKFGSFTFIPSFIVNSSGNNIGGSCVVTGGNCVPGLGTASVTDFSVIVKYENTEDDLEGGVNIIKRIGGSGQDQTYGVATPQGGVEPAGSMNFNVFDLYAKKKFSRVTLGAEVPIISGTLAGAPYQTFGLAGEVTWKAVDSVELWLKTGYASGQAGLSSSTIDTYKAFYFNPNYHLGMIMFNYQLANFGGAQTQNNPNLNLNQLSSPYNNPIVDAAYVAVGAAIKPWDKWTFKPVVVYAIAPQAVGGTSFFYNNWSKQVVANTPGATQGTSLGAEIDLGVTFQWDEYFQFNFDNGLYLPGSFLAFSNTATSNSLSPVFATSVRIGVSF